MEEEFVEAEPAQAESVELSSETPVFDSFEGESPADTVVVPAEIDLPDMDADFDADTGSDAADYFEFPDMPVEPAQDSTYPLDNDVIPPEPVGEPAIDDFVMDRPEPDVNLEPPSLAYVQGINEYGFEGTCGPTTTANSLNTLLGGSEYTENGCLTVAIDNGLCAVDSDPALCGGTSTEQLVELYSQVEPERIDVECYEYDNALIETEIADRIQSGSVVNVAVDSKTLWGEDYGFDAFSDSVVSDHWIEVNGVETNGAGGVVGFNIVDSGGGVDYVDAEQFHAMYVGTPDRMIADPTCIVISRKS